MRVYEPGQRLRHAAYGTGVVLTSDLDYTTLRFRQHGLKKFVTALMQMEAEEDPRPKSVSSPRGHGPAPMSKGAAAGRGKSPVRKAKASHAGKPPASRRRRSR